MVRFAIVVALTAAACGSSAPRSATPEPPPGQLPREKVIARSEVNAPENKPAPPVASAPTDVAAAPTESCGRVEPSKGKLAFSVQLLGDERLSFDRWILDNRPGPTTLRELNRIRLEGDGAEDVEDRVDRPYLAFLAERLTLDELNEAASILSGRGYVNLVLKTRKHEVQVFKSYSPPDLPPIEDGSIATLTLFQFENSIIATSQLTREDASRDILQQKQIELGAFLEECPSAQLLEDLRVLCDHPRHPCARVSMMSAHELPATPFVGALAGLRQIGAAPRVITMGTYPTRKNTRAMREGIGSFFIELIRHSQARKQ
jgi:hypothetical protein